MRKVTIFISAVVILSSLMTVTMITDDAEGLLIDESALTGHDIIKIRSDDDFTSERGVASGTGTASDPYIIENWTIDAEHERGIFIRDTTKYFIIRNCWIWRSNGMMTGGIYLENVENGFIFNNNISDSENGIYVLKSSDILIRDCYFSGNVVSIQTYDNERIIVENNTFWMNNNGVEFAQEKTNSIIRNNYFEKVLGHAIVLRDSDHNRITGNIINFSLGRSHERDSSGLAISIRYSEFNIISDNYCTSDYASGISLYESSNNRITNNHFIATEHVDDDKYQAGLSLHSSGNNVFTSNVFTNGSLVMDGSGLASWTTNSIDTTNTMDGNPINIIKNRTAPNVWNGGSGPIIFANCTNQTIKNMEIQYYKYGIIIGFCTDLTIVQNSISAPWTGIYIKYSDEIRISENDISGSLYGIEIGYSSNTFIDNNSISHCSLRGILISESTGAVIEYNVLFSNDNNIASNTFYLRDQDHIVRYNRISQGGTGIRVNKHGNRIYGNVIDSQKNSGISLTYIEWNSITDNLILNCHTGIEIEFYSYNNTISHNQIMGNRVGIEIVSECSDNNITMNEILDSREYGIAFGFYMETPLVVGNRVFNNSMIGNYDGEMQAGDYGSGNYWDDGFGYGNYWSDYETRYPEAVHNGTVWDTPYDVDFGYGEGANDSYPLVDPPVELEDRLIISGINALKASAEKDYSVQYSYAYSGDRTENITWSFSTNASWLTFDQNQFLKGRPVLSEIGSYWVNISITDGVLYNYNNFTLWVVLTNSPPIITTSNVETVDQWQFYRVDYDAIDRETELEWRLVTGARFLSINSKTGLLSGTPGLNDIGTIFINVSVNDGDLWDYTHFYLTVNDVNDPPMQNSSFTYFLLMEDTLPKYPIHDIFFNYDNDPLEISVSGIIGVNVSLEFEGMIMIIPDQDWNGSGILNFSVSDGHYNKIFYIEVIVQGMNDGPRNLNISIPGTTLLVDGDQVVTAGFYDPDIGDEMNITWYINGIAVSHDISFNLSLGEGKYNLTLRVTDSHGNYTEISIPISVEREITLPPDPPGPDYAWLIVLIVSFLTLAMVGALIFILRRRSVSEEEPDEIVVTPSTPISRRRPGASDLDLEPSHMIKHHGINGGALDEGYTEDIDQEDIPWVQQFDREMDDIMMEALDDEDLRMDSDNIYTAITTLKSKQKNGELSEEDYRILKRALHRIKEE